MRVTISSSGDASVLKARELQQDTNCLILAPPTEGAARRQVITTVLVVDDDSLVTDLIGRVLEKQDYRVLRAQDAESALSILQQHEVDIMITDIQMPGRNGLELTKLARERQPNLSILVMTGNGAKYDRRQALSAGADGFVAKPFKNADLIALVGELVK
jgi:CheY-like chemotaxis protein